MKFNKTYVEGVDFEKYQEYLETIKHKLPKELYDFVSDSERHDLGKRSLHDSHIQKIEYNILNDTTEILIILLGEERKFKLAFSGITQSKLIQLMYGDLYKDLITYEVGIENDKLDNQKIIFRAFFSFNEGIIEIFCDDIKIKETVYNNV